MPSNKYIRVSIDDQQVDLSSPEDADIAVSYKLEDTEDFQQKKSEEAFSIKLPATVQNDKVSNTFHSPDVEDMTSGELFRSPRKAVIEANGYEILVGKAFLKNGSHTDKPLHYEYDFYGGNADWLIDLKEATLHDFLKHITFSFTKAHIIDSWAFDGTSEALPYVFAPVRYGEPMGDPDDQGVFSDAVMKSAYMKPSLSKYWIIYWAFKSIGYRVKSTFFDSPYFRRQVMLWTWGNFLFSEGTKLDDLRFLAISAEAQSIIDADYNDFLDLEVSNDSVAPGFDNNGVYTYDAANKEMKWTYLPALDFGPLEASFHLQLFVQASATAGSQVAVWVHWYKNGVQQNNSPVGDQVVLLHAPTIGRRDFNGIIDNWFTFSSPNNVVAGDVISCKVRVFTLDTLLGKPSLIINVESFQVDYFRVPLGGTINFQNFLGFKKYKFLDFLRGVVDEFNLIPTTDSINKVVYFEPEHAYSLNNNFAITTPGHFNGDFMDFSDKQDLSQISVIDNYSDSERELLFKYRDDSSDGVLKAVQDRHQTTLAQGKYVLPERFKTGPKTIENRFFSPVMHYDVDQWKGITGTAPQMIVMVPENISNTSKDEAQNTFQPKSAYYKGLVAGMGWIFDPAPPFDLGVRTSFPFMFAVNYKPGGENDPILSYSDERIGEGVGAVIGKGLLRRFYLQRMAIMRGGQYYTTFFMLNNSDVSGRLHREHIICRGQRWELVEINDYRPLSEKATSCLLRKWTPVVSTDLTNLFPSASTVLDTAPVTGQFDVKYQALKCLPTDIPK
jgi:hypothetical protein